MKYCIITPWPKGQALFRNNETVYSSLVLAAHGFLFDLTSDQQKLNCEYHEQNTVSLERKNEE